MILHKIVLISLLAVVSLIAEEESMTKATREVRIDGVDYVVQYEYDEKGVYTVPSTMPLGKPHYNATVTVYKKNGKDLQFVDSSRGVYVLGGPCFEDVPKDLVEYALKSKEGE
jgi:uncharacterized protein YxeA